MYEKEHVMATQLVPQLVFNAVDKQFGNLGYLVIDSTIRGRCAGGIRMQRGTTLTELTYLAKTMTLKFGLLGIPFGGAKAGIIADPLLPRKRKLKILKAFGRSLSSFLKNGYFPGSDMGTNDNDIAYVLGAANLVAKAAKKTRASSHTYTGWTVFASAKAAADTLSLDLSNCTVAIQGFGKVGSSVAEVISQTGANIVAVSTREGAIYDRHGLNPGKLLKLKDEVGDDLVRDYGKATRITKEDLLGLGTDILFPCAGSWSIDSSNVEKIKSKIICPGANIPVTLDAEENLFERGMVCLPDFVTNCGGVLGGYLRSFLSDREIRNIIDGQYVKMVSGILELSKSKNMSPRRISQRMAERRFLEMKLNIERRNLRNELFRIGSRLLTKRLIPKTLLRFTAPARIAFQFKNRKFVRETDDETRTNLG